MNRSPHRLVRRHSGLAALPACTRAVLITALFALASSACADPARPPEADARPGTVIVTVATTGVDRDPNGYRVAIGDRPETSLPTDGEAILSGIPAGSHVVVLTGVGSNCAVQDGVTRTVTVAPDGRASVHFTVTCAVRELAFVSDRDGDTELYVMRADGTGLRRLTTSPGRDMDPAWSPDGQRLAFSSNRHGDITRDADLDVYVMAADGSGVTSLTTTPGADNYPTWSPDGRRLAYVSHRDGPGGVYVMNADGTGHRRVSDAAGGAFAPSWSPDGSRITYQAIRDGTLGIFVVAPDGSGLRRLTPATSANWSPAWSPDGTRLAFVSERDGRGQLYVMDADGANARRVIESGEDDANVAWSPDGQRLAFARYGRTPAGAPQSDLYVTALDGSTLLRLTQDTGLNHTPAWRP